MARHHTDTGPDAKDDWWIVQFRIKRVGNGWGSRVKFQTLAEYGPTRFPLDLDGGTDVKATLTWIPIADGARARLESDDPIL